jgi:hypothetical protein
VKNPWLPWDNNLQIADFPLSYVSTLGSFNKAIQNDLPVENGVFPWPR